MQYGNRLTPAEEEKLFREYCRQLGPVDRVYILHTGKNKLTCAKDKPPPLPLPIKTRIRNYFVGIRQNPVFVFFSAIGKGIYFILALQLLLLLPVVINKCSVRPPLY